jgi:S-DNA-T family DNA segregation ATPase FtsK/SpoIIIE
LRTRLTLRQSQGNTTDLVVTTDVGATVGDVADAIVRSEAAAGRPSSASTVTLRLEPPDRGPERSLRRSSGLVEAGLGAGSIVEVISASDARVEPGVDPSRAYARLHVVAGPQTGLEVDLPSGATTIGRGADSDIRLTDPMVSKTHARILVTDVVEIADAGSANGVILGDGLVEHALLGPDDLVVLGETVIRVSLLRAAEVAGLDGATIRFNRSPRVVPVYAERAVEAPAPPDPLNPGRFPLLAMIAPLAMGVVLFLLMHNPMTVIFVALSPLLMVGTYVDKRFTDRKRLKTQTAEFKKSLSTLATELETAQADERRVRLGEVPSTTEAVAAGFNRDPLLWSRRPEHATFLTVRVGTGAAPSRTTLTMPPRGKAVAEHWSELEAVRARFAEVTGVPVLVDLRVSGAIGVAGPRGMVDDVARALIAQLVCLHSPAELVLTAIASSQSSARWDWLKWLPHVASAHSPLSGPHLAASPAAAIGIVTRLEELVAERRKTGDRRSTPMPAVVLVAEDDAQADRGRLVRLAEEGPAVGVHVLWCSASVDALPAVCRSFVSLTSPETPARVGVVQDGVWSEVVCEGLGLDVATDLARRMAAVVDAGAPVIDESDLPRAVSFLGIAGPEIAEDPTAVIGRWRETGSLLDRSGAPAVRRRTDASLRALVGQGSAGEFLLDLRGQGPHALVGGTTGAGKSEFLQAWVLGMAAAHSPDRISFLFVDYKGGAAFADCVELPHSVGLVTDLSPHLVRRALTSLRAELRRREHLLNRKKVKDLLALERIGDPETPPALVIVVDEFAALVTEVPEFVDGMVDVAQRGRSLGLHLILATQRPAGVIKDNLRANTNLRVALRMADEHDSTDVLGSPLAAAFDPSVPGRGAVRTGPGRIAVFQTGYVGGRSSSVPVKAAVGIESLVFGPGESWDVPAAPDSAGAADDDGPTDVTRTVRTIAAAARSAAVPAPRRPWLPELAPVYDLAGLAPETDSLLALGMLDVPADQAQNTVHIRPDQDGSIVIFGTSGSGKSTALRTLAVGAGMSTRRGPVHVYGLDFGSGGLNMLEPLPHVGSVIDGSDTERVGRLLRQLRTTLEERSARYAQARATSITEYRALAQRPDEPRILVLLDGLSAFREAYETEPGRAQAWAAFQRVVAEGRPLGLHVAMTAERPGALPTSLAGSVQRRLVLRQADENAYGVLDVPKDVLSPQSPPGRGVMSGTTEELQVAVLGGSANASEQAARIDELAAAMRTDGVTEAPAVHRLASFIELSTLPSAVDGMPVLGVADDTLEPIGFSPHGTFLLAGLPGSGRTTVLTTLATTLRRFAPEAPLYYVGNRRSPVHAAEVWTEVAVTPDDAAALAKSLLPVLGEPTPTGCGVILVIESITDFLGGPAEQALTEAVKAARRNDHFVIAESETSTWGSAWPLVAEVRNGRRGLVLQPDHLDGDGLFRTAFPRMSRAEFPPGRGVFVESGKLRRVQVPVPH